QPSTNPGPETESSKEVPKSAGSSGKLTGVSTSVVDNRLQVSADVDADEIDALITMLQKYKEILKLMN
ncbi:MAG: hypothetical protein AAFR28_08970, partial [Pseudomonadota bacterium]